MKAAGIEDPNDIERVRALGVIDLPTIQKKANLHFSLTLDLFGNEISTNAANAFNAGIKGRYREDKLADDHQLLSSTYPVLRLRDGAIVREDAPALSALNMRLRDDFVDDAAADPDGNILTAAQWGARSLEFLPSDDDNRFVASLMSPVRERGQYAGWIAPPRAGIDNMPGDFEYVRIAE